MSNSTNQLLYWRYCKGRQSLPRNHLTVNKDCDKKIEEIEYTLIFSKPLAILLKESIAKHVDKDFKNKH